jgi:hypothetical protein
MISIRQEIEMGEGRLYIRSSIPISSISHAISHPSIFQLNTTAKMPFTEFVVPTLKTDPVTEATFTTEIAPILITILDTHATPPKSKHFGKILLENGNDVSGDFRLCVGLGSSFSLPSPFLSLSSFPFS